MRHWKIRVIALAAIGALTGTLVMAGAGTAKKGAEGPAWGVHATLSGKREVSPEGKKKAGDPNGHGVFAATIEGTQFCFGLTVGAINTPTAAHIHQGKRGKNGPIVITLAAPSSSPGASSGCVNVDPALLTAIRKHPQRFYANVHTGDFPGGAVRGQLRKSKAN